MREMLLLELQKTATGLTEELMNALVRNGLDVPATTIERQLQALADDGLVERSTYVRLTAKGYLAAAEIAKRR
jgi:Mn-dependent DtxR family transcriptional regulator